MTHTAHGQRVAIVTGAARGIGGAMAERFAHDGLAVAVVDLREAECADTVAAITGGGGRAAAFAADVDDEVAVATAGRVDYASAKAGLIGFTKSLALQLGPHGVTANAIAPGFVVSEMTRAAAGRRGRTFEEHQRIVAQSIPVRRVGRPEDIAHTASYLVSAGAGLPDRSSMSPAGRWSER